jgi:hypothetical protein
MDLFTDFWYVSYKAFNGENKSIENYVLQAQLIEDKINLDRVISHIKKINEGAERVVILHIEKITQKCWENMKKELK